MVYAGPARMVRVSQNHIFIRMYGVHTVFLAGESRSCMVCIYGPVHPTYGLGLGVSVYLMYKCMTSQ